MSELSEIDEAMRYAKTMKRAHVCRYECYLPFLFMDFKRARISEVDGKKCTHKKKNKKAFSMVHGNDFVFSNIFSSLCVQQVEREVMKIAVAIAIVK